MARVDGSSAGHMTHGGLTVPVQPRECEGCIYRDRDGRGGVCSMYPDMKPSAVISGSGRCSLREQE